MPLAVEIIFVESGTVRCRLDDWASGACEPGASQKSTTTKRGPTKIRNPFKCVIRQDDDDQKRVMQYFCNVLRGVDSTFYVERLKNSKNQSIFDWRPTIKRFVPPRIKAVFECGKLI